jgi:hypothetical protein
MTGLGNLLDHLVGAGEQRTRHLKAECLRGFQIGHQLVLGRSLRASIRTVFAAAAMRDRQSMVIGIIEHPFDNARCIRFRQTAHHLPKREPPPESESGRGSGNPHRGGLGGNSIRQNTLGAVIVLTAHSGTNMGTLLPAIGGDAPPFQTRCRNGPCTERAVKVAVPR